jgi:hypothetical protein
MAGKWAFQIVESHKVFGQTRKQPKMFRTGLYARVSTNDQQTLPMQSRAMAGLLSVFSEFERNIPRERDALIWHMPGTTVSAWVGR